MTKRLNAILPVVLTAAAAKAIRKLVREAWRTNLELAADTSGVISFRGFRGRYRITGTDPEGRPCVKEVTVAGDAPVAIEPGPEWNLERKGDRK